jgi:hypothetical protein
MQSPIFILPIRGTLAGKYAPIWVIKTGDVLVKTSEEQYEEDEKEDRASVFEQLSLDKHRTSEKTRFTFAKLARYMMRGQTMPKSRSPNADFFDQYDIRISQISLIYYQSYEIY